MARLLVFNPEHDYALAHGGKHYMAPASVKRLATRLELLPYAWSRPGDLVLTSSNQLISVDSDEAVNFQSSATEEITEVLPWGWDNSIRQRLTDLGILSTLLPTEADIENLRRLSHRRISIDGNIAMGSPSIPCELMDLDSVMEFASAKPGCYLKMPWSSGGRGVLATKELNAAQIKEWASGAIRRQGSVLAENGIERALDFASLWECRDEGTYFLGFSVSLSDGRGKYHGNLSGPQEELWKIIKSKAPGLDEGIIQKQKDFISQAIAPYYSGLLGIDMMADRDGILYPCVEINLRRTMGHVAMDFYTLTPDRKQKLVSSLKSSLL